MCDHAMVPHRPVLLEPGTRVEPPLFTIRDEQAKQVTLARGGRHLTWLQSTHRPGMFGTRSRKSSRLSALCARPVSAPARPGWTSQTPSAPRSSVLGPRLLVSISSYVPTPTLQPSPPSPVTHCSGAHSGLSAELRSAGTRGSRSTPQRLPIPRREMHNARRSARLVPVPWGQRRHR